jgi:DNA-binding NarL/FixJ family response regulator
MLVDDHRLFRRGIASVLRAEPGFEVVGEAEDGAEAIAQAPVVQPDVILMDVRMPRVGGLEATRQILETLPQTKIIMLTMAEDEDAVFEAMKNGAQGYLLKTAEPEELFDALHGILCGEAPLSGGLAAKLLSEFARRAPRPPEPAPQRTTLSPREREILARVADGKSNKEIATDLDIAENTVKNHIKNVLEKLHLEHRVRAAVFAIREDMVAPSRTSEAAGPPTQRREAA